MKTGKITPFEEPQNNPNFGALYMPRLSAAIEKERSNLANLARDVDIFVMTDKEKQRLFVQIQEITPPFSATGSSVSKYFALRKYKKELNSKPFVHDEVLGTHETLASMLYAKALSLKIQYDKKFRPKLDYAKTPTPVKLAS